MALRMMPLTSKKTMNISFLTDVLIKTFVGDEELRDFHTELTFLVSGSQILTHISSADMIDSRNWLPWVLYFFEVTITVSDSSMLLLNIKNTLYPASTNFSHT